MKLFYGEIYNDSVLIHDEEQNHISKALRLKENEQIFITDGKGNLAKGTLFFEGKKTCINPIEIKRNLPFLPHKIHIAIAPTKNIDRTEFFVEKATEMGVNEISFLLTDKSERKQINIEKLRKKSISASKQSLRVHFPILHDLKKFSDFVKTISPENTYVAHCDKNFIRKSLNEISLSEKITFLVGPEGDFSPNEIELLQKQKITAISLGSQRLRTETAGIFLSSWGYYKNF